MGIAIPRSQRIRSEDIGYGWETVGGLGGGNVMNMRSRRQVGGLIHHMPGRWLGLMSTGERLVEGSGLNHSFVGEL